MTHDCSTSKLCTLGRPGLEGTALQVQVQAAQRGPERCVVASTAVSCSLLVAAYVDRLCVSVCCRLLQLYQHMQQRGIEPTVATFGTLITIASEAQAYEK
jgi:hypothetical protein